MGRIDVTVRGGGVFGLAVAWAATLGGARVRLVEARRIGAGASGGVLGALAPHAPDHWTPLKAFQLESLMMAEAWWAEVAAAGGGDPGYCRTGRLQPLADDAAIALAETRAEAARHHWRGGAIWRVAEAAAFPFAPASPSGLLIHDTLSARLHPSRATRALAAALLARGGEIVEGAEAPDEGVVVHATGWEGLAELSTAIRRPVGTGVKGQALLLAHDARGAPQLYAGGLHIVPHADGTTAVGSTSERDFADPTTTDAQLDALHARAIAACPALAGAPVLERWAGARPRARTRAPILGPWPNRPGHFVANGGFKIGFGLAPKVGKVLAEWILEGHEGIPEAFRVEAAL